MIWIDLFQVSMWKDAQQYYSPGKCKFKKKLDTTSNSQCGHNQWRNYCVTENVKKWGPLDITDRTIK